LLSAPGPTDDRSIRSPRGVCDVAADIVDAIALPAKDGGKVSHAVWLGRKDGQGAVHPFGPTRIGQTLWIRITQDG
jgi:hypothetical protein